MSDKPAPDAPQPLPYREIPVRPDRRRGIRWWAIPAVIATIVSLAVALVTLAVIQADLDRTIDESAQSAADAAEDSIRQTQVAGCDRSLIGRGLTRAFPPPGADALFEEYLTIYDCEATYERNQGRQVPLSPGLQGCFVRLVRNGYFLEHPATTDPVELAMICRENP